MINQALTGTNSSICSIAPLARLSVSSRFLFFSILARFLCLNIPSNSHPRGVPHTILPSKNHRYIPANVLLPILHQPVAPYAGDMARQQCTVPSDRQ